MIYISLTTVPKRLKYGDLIKMNLLSLLKQKTEREYFVILNAPYTYTLTDGTDPEYLIPEEVINLTKEYPNFIINRNIIDYGPIIKVAGALMYSNNPDDIIIGVDDDVIYHEDMLEYQIKKMEEYPNHVICFGGDRAMEKRTFLEDGVRKFVFYGTYVYFPIQIDCYLKVPGHCLSVGYKRSYFKEDFNEDLWKLCIGDDPLMGYYLKKHEIWPICCAWDGDTDFRPIRDECNPKPFWTFPVIHEVPYPELAAGTRIRELWPGTVHGYSDDSLMDFLSNNDFAYIEKNQ